MKSRPTTVVFDIGNVLVGWDPRNLYRRLFDGRHDEMEWFLANVCNNEWNLEQDRGRSFAEGVETLIQSHPEALHPMIRAYDRQWHEMLSGEIPGTVEILEMLSRQTTPVYAITNWNQHKFQQARGMFGFLDCFHGIIVSGDEGLLKPDPAIFHLLFDRYSLRAGDCVFIDDSLKNVKGAEAVGMHALLFETPEKLASDLRNLGFTL
jgi:HAD superfamily hydrolase (TIGR01509 family)